MKIKALSLWEPWASLMRAGAKRVETRSWSTTYRGPLLICAAKRRDKASLDLLFEPQFCAGISSLPPGEVLHFGFAVAVVDLIACVPTHNRTIEHEHLFTASELAFGDYSPGRFAWVTAGLRQITPFEVRGEQGLFETEIPVELLNAG